MTGGEMEKRFWVYMMASERYGTLYIWMTSDIVKRVWEHKNSVVEGFTQKYEVHNLVWFEEYTMAENAIKREKRLKKYNRDWKINLINEKNPHWNDLYESICM